MNTEYKTPRIGHLIETMKGVSVVAGSTAPNPRDVQKIVLIGEVDNEGDCRLFLISNSTHGLRKEIFLRQSLKFACHSVLIGWGRFMNPTLQTSLALCIALYGVSNGRKVYVDFAKKYLAELPSGEDFTKELNVSI